MISIGRWVHYYGPIEPNDEGPYAAVCVDVQDNPTLVIYDRHGGMHVRANVPYSEKIAPRTWCWPPIL